MVMTTFLVEGYTEEISEAVLVNGMKSYCCETNLEVVEFFSFLSEGFKQK